MKWGQKNEDTKTTLQIKLRTGQNDIQSNEKETEETSKRKTETKRLQTHINKTIKRTNDKRWRTEH